MEVVRCQRRSLAREVQRTLRVHRLAPGPRPSPGTAKDSQSLCPLPVTTPPFTPKSWS